MTQDGDIDQRSISTWPGAAVQVLRSSLSTALTPVPAPVPAPAPPSHGRCATGDLSQSGSCDARGTHRESAAAKKTHSWTNPHLDATKAGVRPPRPASPASHQHPLSQWRQTQRSAPRRRPSRSIPFSRTLPNCQCLPKPPDTRLARFDSRSKNTSSLIWRLGHVGRHQHNQACLSWKPFFSFFAAEELGDCAYCWAVSQPVTGEVSQRVTQVEAPAPSRRPQVWGLLALQWPIHRAGMFRPGLQNGRSH